MHEVRRAALSIRPNVPSMTIWSLERGLIGQRFFIFVAELFAISFAYSVAFTASHYSK